MTGVISQIRQEHGKWIAVLSAMDPSAGVVPDGAPVWLDSGEQGEVATLAPAKLDPVTPRVTRQGESVAGDYKPDNRPILRIAAFDTKPPKGAKFTTNPDIAKGWYQRAAKAAAPSRLALSSATWKTRIGPLVSKAELATTPQEAIAAYNDIVKERREISIPSEVARRLVPLEDLRQLGSLVRESPETRDKVKAQFARDYAAAGNVAADVLSPVATGAGALWDSIPTWGKAAIIGGAALLVINEVK